MNKFAPLVLAFLVGIAALQIWSSRGGDRVETGDGIVSDADRQEVTTSTVTERTFVTLSPLPSTSAAPSARRQAVTTANDAGRSDGEEDPAGPTGNPGEGDPGDEPGDGEPEPTDEPPSGTGDPDPTDPPDTDPPPPDTDPPTPTTGGPVTTEDPEPTDPDPTEPEPTEPPTPTTEAPKPTVTIGNPDPTVGGGQGP